MAEEEENEGSSGATTVINEREAGAAIERARAVFREANAALCKANSKEQRVQLIEEWKTFEVGLLVQCTWEHSITFTVIILATTCPLAMIKL